MHRNQYLITFQEMDANELGLSKLKFCGMTVYHHPSLRATVDHHESSGILLLGYIIDPQKPGSTDADLVHSLVTTCPAKEQLFKRLQALSGRFVIIYKSSEDLIAVGDPCGSRQIYYQGDKCVLTSSLQLFWDATGTAPKISAPKEAILGCPEYEVAERAWIGTESPDDRVHKVLPNHYLNMRSRAVYRIPVDTGQLVAEKDGCEYAAEVLRGSMEGIRSRFEALQTLTAGFDTRTLLAAARDFAAETEFFVFACSDEDESFPDLYVPLRLSRKLSLYFRIVRPPPLKAVQPH